MSDEDNKGGDTNEPITIRVKDQTGEETMFKIKKSTKMSKVFTAYAQRKGVDQGSLRFLLDGERISETDTPKMLELEDEDQIDCVLAQVGGADDDNDEDKKDGGGGDGNEPITIRVKDQNGEETMFKIKKTTRMKKVFATYAARKGVEANASEFLYNMCHVTLSAIGACAMYLYFCAILNQIHLPLLFGVFLLWDNQYNCENNMAGLWCTKIMTIILGYAVRFMLDGENINPESTPGDMDLEDDDQIDCFLAQVGGH